MKTRMQVRKETLEGPQDEGTTRLRHEVADQLENVMKRKRGHPKGSGFENKSTTSKATKEALKGKQYQDMNPEHNEVDVRSNGYITCSLPSEHQQCRQCGGKNWRCPSMPAPGKAYCAKHQLARDVYNEKRRNELKSCRKKESRLSMDPLPPSGQHQCRHLGKRWRCLNMASPGKLHCEKHQLTQNLNNIKRRKTQKCLVTSGCDEIKCFNGDHPTCLESTGEEEDDDKEEDIQVRCPKNGSGVKHVNSDEGLVESGIAFYGHGNPKRCTELLSSTVEGQQVFAVHLEKPASPTSEGIHFETANHHMTIEQIGHSQLSSLILKEHQAHSSSSERSSHRIVEDNKGTENDADNSNLNIAKIDHTFLLNSTMEDQVLSSCNEMSNPPVMEITKEASDTNLTNAHIDHKESFSPTLEEHQTLSSFNERSNFLIVEDNQGTGTEDANNNLTISQIEHTQAWSSVLEDGPALHSVDEFSDFMMEDGAGTDEQDTKCIEKVCMELLGPSVEELQTSSLCCENSNAPRIGDESGSFNLGSVQIDSTQSVCKTLEEHHTSRLCGGKPILQIVNDNEDNQLMPNEATPHRETVKSPNHHQSSYEVDSLNTCLSPLHLDQGIQKDSLPFLKCSLMWKTIEAHKAFELIPQNPHFLPLEKENEELREGKAMGHVLNFTHLMDIMRNASLDDSKRMFEIKLEALHELEVFGFTVQPLRSRLKKMIELKDESNQFQERLKTIRAELTDEKHNADVIQESIARLNSEIQAVLMQEEISRLKVAEIQKTANEIDGRILAARLDFDAAVRSSW